jgi:hypothetical protein
MILPQFELKTDGRNLMYPHQELQYPITVLSHQNSATFSHSLSVFNNQFLLEQKFHDLDWKNSFAPTNVCMNQENLLETTLPTPHPASLEVKHRSIAPEILIKSSETSSVPGLLLGELDSHPAALAVAVDSQIVAFSAPILKDNHFYINALIPEKYLSPGKHSVTIYNAADIGCNPIE